MNSANFFFDPINRALTGIDKRRTALGNSKLISIISLILLIFVLVYCVDGYANSPISKKDVDKHLKTIGVDLDDVAVQIVGGYVSIYGAVNSLDTKNAINRDLAKISGVTKIINNVLVYPELDQFKKEYSSIKNGVIDTWRIGDFVYHIGNDAKSIPDCHLINAYSRDKKTIIIAQCGCDESKSKLLQIFKNRYKNVSKFIDLIYVYNESNFSTPEYTIISLDKAVKKGNLDLFKRFFTKQSVDLYGQIVKDIPPDILANCKLDNLFPKLLNSYKLSEINTFTKKSVNHTEFAPTVFKNLLDNDLRLEKNNEDWTIDLAEDLKRVYIPRIVKEYIKLSEKDYDFEKASGDPKKAEQHLLIALKYDPNNYAARNYAGILLLTEGKYDEAIAEFNKCVQIDNSVSTAHYNLARVYARKQLFEDALQSLKKAGGYSDFSKNRKDIIKDFQESPIVLCSLPDDIKEFAYQTNQMFDLRDDALKTQTELNKLITFEKEPSEEILRARHALDNGRFDAAYINYMRHVTGSHPLTDDKLNQFLESISIWQFAYVARITQIAKSLFDVREMADDANLLRMIHPEWKRFLKVISNNEPPSVVNSYRGRYSKLLQAFEKPEGNTKIGAERIMGYTDSLLLTGALGAPIIYTYYHYGDFQKRKKSTYELLRTLPDYKITEWKEATLDYARLKKHYKECLEVMDAVVQNEKKGGNLSSESLDKLVRVKELFENYFIYIDKMYRAFLFDSPMTMNLVNLRLRLQYAEGYIWNNHPTIQEVGRQYSKLTPVLRYVALDKTHRQWEETAKELKKKLKTKEFDELKQEAKTLPDWFAEID